MSQPAAFITPDALLAHWQGHRRLTRRVIESFPEDQLFTYTIGGMRPFGELAIEMLGMAVPMLEGVVTDKWNWAMPEVKTRSALLDLWDESAETLSALWTQVPPERFQQTMTAFGKYTGVVHDLLLYVIDNEVHHRAQGFVYLRALGITPPAFYERA